MWAVGPPGGPQPGLPWPQGVVGTAKVRRRTMAGQGARQVARSPGVGAAVGLRGRARGKGSQLHGHGARRVPPLVTAVVV